MEIDLTVPGLGELHLRHSKKWAAHAPDVLCATIAEMDFPLAAPVATALHAAIDRSDLGYTPPRSPSLLEALSGFARRRLGWAIDPAQVTLAPDVMVAIVELCRALTGDGGSIGFATPAYPPFFRELSRLGVPFIQLPLTETGAHDLDRLGAAIDDGLRVLVLANPHNPTGRVLPPAELQEIAGVCAERGVWVLADEIHAPLTLPGATPTPWLEVGAAATECGIALTSASKAFNLAGLKTAFIVTASERTRGRVARLPLLSDHVGLLGTVAAEAAFTDGDDWLDAVLGQLAANRRLLTERLAAELPQVRFTAPQATYLAWLDCTGCKLGDEPAGAFLERGRVALGRGLDYGPPGAGHVRLNFGTSPELVTEAVARMKTSVS